MLLAYLPVYTVSTQVEINLRPRVIYPAVPKFQSGGSTLVIQEVH